MNDTEIKLNELVEKAKLSKDFTELEGFCLSPEYQALPYAIKNYPFITASKLKAFEQCQLGYKYEYVDLVAKPEGMDDKDHFIIGRAFDDLITLGEPTFKERYCVMQKRINNLGEEIEALKIKAEEGRSKFNKDGSRSATGVQAEVDALNKITYYNTLVNKTQLTENMMKQIEQMRKEFNAQEMFNPNPAKKVFIWEYSGFLCKAELDDYVQDGAINDLKTSSSVFNFKPEMYDLQASFYNWGVEEKTMLRAEVNLEVVDKYDYFSRSMMVKYTLSTLISNRGRILTLLGELKDATESDIWIASKDEKVLFSSPFYGHEGYGRPTKPIIY